MTDELARVVALIESDVRHTVGGRYQPIVAAVAARLVEGGAVDGPRLVEQVQEELHETWVDTTWPACPRHGGHPLWYHEDGWWWCEADAVALCRLGELGTRRVGVDVSSGESS